MLKISKKAEFGKSERKNDFKSFHEPDSYLPFEWSRTVFSFDFFANFKLKNSQISIKTENKNELSLQLLPIITLKITRGLSTETSGAI